MKLPRFWRRQNDVAADQLANAQKALEHLEKNVAPEVQRDAARARRMRVENHLGPTLAAALEGRSL